MSDGGSVARSVTDGELLRELYEQHGSDLTAYVMRLTGGDHARSQDAVQETFLRAWRDLGVLLQGRGSVRGWLFTVARRVVIDDWRSAQRKEQALATMSAPTSVSDPAEDILTRLLVRAALSRLSAAHRQVLVDCYIRDLSVSEAATRLGIPTGTVKSRCHYALIALRLALEELGAGR
jgi:RNA polymerase sigma-70 factor (ECF subfamily)